MNERKHIAIMITVESDVYLHIASASAHFLQM